MCRVFLVQGLAYFLLAAPAFAQREIEPNDTRDPASEVVYAADGTPVRGQISSSSDIDYYAYDLSVGEFTAYVRMVSDDVNYTRHHLDLLIMDADGNTLSARDIADEQTSFISFGAQIAEAGRYYIRVEYGDGTVYEDYEIEAELDLLSTSAREIEPNDTRDPASEVVYAADGTPVRGQISSSSDIDYYAYDLSVGEFTAYVRMVSDDVNYTRHHLDLLIMDADGNTLSARDIADEQTSFISFGAQIAEAGRYYIRVEYGDGTVYEDYEIEAEIEGAGGTGEAGVLVAGDMRIRGGSLVPAAPVPLSNASGTRKLRGATLSTLAAGHSSSPSGNQLKAGVAPISVPEPSFFWQFGAGVFGLVALRRFRQREQSKPQGFALEKF